MKRITSLNNRSYCKIRSCVPCFEQNGTVCDLEVNEYLQVVRVLPRWIKHPHRKFKTIVYYCIYLTWYTRNLTFVKSCIKLFYKSSTIQSLYIFDGRRTFHLNKIYQWHLFTMVQVVKLLYHWPVNSGVVSSNPARGECPWL